MRRPGLVFSAWGFLTRVLLGALAWSCGGEGSPLGDPPPVARSDALPATGCELETVPAALSFGAVQRTRSLRRAIELRNVGERTCELAMAWRCRDGAPPQGVTPSAPLRIPVGGLEVITLEVGPDSPCSLCGGPAELVLAPSVGEETVLPVAWTPPQPVDVLVVPSPLDFGSHPRDLVSARDLTVYNPGSQPLTVRAALTGSPTFRLELDEVVAPPGASAVLAIALSDDPGVHSGQLILQYELELPCEGGVESRELTVELMAEVR